MVEQKLNLSQQDLIKKLIDYLDNKQKVYSEYIRKLSRKSIKPQIKTETKDSKIKLEHRSVASIESEIMAKM